jgi:uncharacterized protein (DUF983 family)
MEFCANCEEIKPYRVVEFFKRYVKNCRDCGSQMGFISIEEINKIIVERDFYKKKFYERELKNEKET